MALGAFGLESEIDKKAFIRKILEDGTTDPASLANRLTDKSWHKLTEAFGFGDPGGARTGEASFAAKLVEAYKTRAFEAAVGDADNDMRLAMNFRREIAELAKGEGGSWFSVLGSKPLRQVDREGLRAAEGSSARSTSTSSARCCATRRARCSAPTSSPPSRMQATSRS